ncbi:MAG TPA: PIN domain-containing protein [Verrucomicrobiae bacterium]
MSYLLDTDIVSAFHKRTVSLKLASWLAKNEDDCFISVITIAEMRHGLRFAPELFQEELMRRIEVAEDQFAESLISLDLEILVRWKQLLAELKSINRTMTCEDSLLAATCLANDFVMATNNVRHFEPARQFGLMIENPLA